MAKHGKNKRFSGDNFERFRKRETGQDALERDRNRKNSNRVRPIPTAEDDYIYDYESEEFFSENN